MFISKKRSAGLFLLILISLWVVFQNVSFHKTLFKSDSIRHEAIQLSQIQTLQKDIQIKRVSFEFHPPPRFDGEAPSDGYTVEDMYFRRWQIAHNVQPVRVHREKGNDAKRWKGWSFKDHHRLPEDYINDALKRRQEDRIHHVEELKKQQMEEQLRQTQESEAANGDLANDMSSSYTVQNSWLKARLDDYCNEKGTMSGDEGQIPRGYSLQSVYVLARHGDRTPLENVKTGKLAPFKWECSLTEANKQKSSLHMEKFLKMIQNSLKDVSSFDQELKSEVLRIPVRDWSVGCYSSQLTPQGWIQHMRLGDFLKKRYWNLLNLGHDGSRKVSFKSTTSPRTIQSAVAFIFGFLPRFTVSNINKIKKTDQPTFCSEDHCMCGAVEKLKEKVQSEYTTMHKRKNISILSKQASRLMYTKQPLYSITNPYRLIELLTSRACHKSNLPCTDNGCVDENTFSKVFRMIDSITAELHKTNSSADMYGRLAMHPLLSTMSSTMRYIDRGQSKLPRFYLYMGHDITLTPMLDALGLFYPWPGYASRLVLEHWHHSSSNQSALRWFYNGMDMTQEVRFCSGKLNNEGLCPFEAFFHFVDTENLRFFNAVRYEDACAWGIDSE